LFSALVVQIFFSGILNNMHGTNLYSSSYFIRIEAIEFTGVVSILKRIF